ncbi:hypothetical protein IFR05_010115, partial [Cadophora sp. M221]
MVDVKEKSGLEQDQDRQSVTKIQTADEDRHVEQAADVLKGAQQATDSEHTMSIAEGLRK